MTKQFIRILLGIALALPAYAGQGTIQENDSQIIVEYTGTPDDVKESPQQKEEEENKMTAEEKKAKAAQQRIERAKSKAAKGMIPDFDQLQ